MKISMIKNTLQDAGWKEVTDYKQLKKGERIAYIEVRSFNSTKPSWENPRQQFIRPRTEYLLESGQYDGFMWVKGKYPYHFIKMANGGTKNVTDSYLFSTPVFAKEMAENLPEPQEEKEFRDVTY